MCALARASRSPQLILSQRTVKVPDGVKVEVKARKVTVSGPRGTLTREFKHIQLDIILQDPSTVRVDMWFGKRKAIACIRTICSHIENMITGVTKGYLYKMRFVYSHFPINVSLSGRTVEIRNYLGEKLVRRVKLVDGRAVDKVVRCIGRVASARFLRRRCGQGARGGTGRRRAPALLRRLGV